MATRALARHRFQTVRKKSRGSATDLVNVRVVPTLDQGQRSPSHIGVIREIQSSRPASGSLEVEKKRGASELATVDAADDVTGDAFNDDLRIIVRVGESHDRPHDQQQNHCTNLRDFHLKFSCSPKESSWVIHLPALGECGEVSLFSALGQAEINTS
jgi:hypothetical protein